ncbi:MAG: hypothetical protein ABJE95_12370 [Byssovorax sp.]
MMFYRVRWALLASVALSLGCAVPTLESRRDAAAPAITALQRGSFESAGKLAAEGLAADGDNPYGRLVRAIVRAKKTQHQLAIDGMTVIGGGVASGALNQKYLRTTLGDAEAELGQIEADLGVVAEQKGLSVELCLACWDIDWNGNGRVDDRDRRLMEIEEDAEGNPIPEGDPRRRPTFRFDDGDVAWARAFVSFERAALDVVMAYDWSEAAALAARRRDRPKAIVIRLLEPDRIAQARARLLEGLSQSDAARRAYLAETDDDREWVPSPRQKSHPMPLPVDQALYATWEGVLGDLHRIVESEEGIHAGDALALLGERPRWPVHGYLDVGRMLSHPKDITLDLRDLERFDEERDVDAIFASVLGEYYVHEMKASPLPKRLERMKGEVDQHREGLEHKLRYLFWLN